MTTYEIQAVFHSTDNILIEADSEVEALKKFNEGNYDSKISVGHDLQEIVYVRELGSKQ